MEKHQPKLEIMEENQIKSAEEVLKSYVNIEFDMDVIQSIDIRPLDLVAAFKEFAQQYTSISIE